MTGLLQLHQNNNTTPSHCRRPLSHLVENPGNDPGIPIPLNKDILIKVTEIASFLNISESNLVVILQNVQISVENVEEFLPFIHRLLTRGYPNIAKECSIRGRLSLQLLNEQTISYNKFKKTFRKAKCL